MFTATRERAPSRRVTVQIRGTDRHGHDHVEIAHLGDRSLLRDKFELRARRKHRAAERQRHLHGFGQHHIGLFWVAAAAGAETDDVSGAGALGVLGGAAVYLVCRLRTGLPSLGLQGSADYR